MITIKNGKVFMGGSLVNADIYIENDKITKIAQAVLKAPAHGHILHGKHSFLKNTLYTIF